MLLAGCDEIRFRLARRRRGGCVLPEREDGTENAHQEHGQKMPDQESPHENG